MVLYKATKDGNVEMTKEEESKIRADWAEEEIRKDQPKPKSLEERVIDLETAVSILSKDK